MSSHTVPTLPRAKVKDVIRFSVENSDKIKLPLMIWGYHGIGKTQLVKDIAEEMDYNLVILHLATQDIIDLIGRPVASKRLDPTTNKEVDVQEWCVPSWLQDSRELSNNNNKPTIFFLDEFNRGPKIVCNAMLPFLIEGKMHTHSIGEKDVIIAAANPPSEDYEVNDLEDKAQLDRLGHVVLKTSIDEYIKYLKDTNMDSFTISVINSNRKLLSIPNIDPGIELTASMRSVDYVMKKVGKKDTKWVNQYASDVIHCYLGENFKDLWLAERSQYNDSITMDMLLNYDNNENFITDTLTSVIDNIQTTNISILEKLTDNIINYFEDNGGICKKDCEWFVKLLQNERMEDEELKKIFSKDIVKESLIKPEINKMFNDFAKKVSLFNNVGIEVW